MRSELKVMVTGYGLCNEQPKTRHEATRAKVNGIVGLRKHDGQSETDTFICILRLTAITLHQIQLYTREYGNKGS